MIDDAGTAKVMDFGIAKPASAGTDSGASTGYVLGSPEYMSPEQARGRRADFRSDLYSLGIVVFEAFTGRVPFRGATPVETLMMHVEAPPPIDDPALALPPALLPVLRSALAKDPAARFADATSMAVALRAARGGVATGVDASRTEVVHTRRLPVAPWRTARAVVVGAAVVAAAVAAALLTRRAPEGAPVTSSSPSAAVAPSPAVISPLPYTLATDVPVATTPVPVRESPPTASRASPSLGTSSPPSAAAPAVTLPFAPSPSATPSATAASVPPREAVVVPTTPAAPPPTPAPPLEGWLLVLPKPWAEVTVDGRVVGQTPLARIPLPPDPTPSSSRIRTTGRSRDGSRSAEGRRRPSGWISRPTACGAE